MRLVALVALVVPACGFQVSGGAPPVDDASGDAPGDAAGDASIDAPIDAAIDAPPDVPPAACLSDGAYVTNVATGHRYFAATIPLSWAAAAAVCAGTGAHLAVLDDLTENGYVDDLLAGAFWIGLSDLALEGTWLWVTGDPVTGGFTSWRTGNPNNGDGGPTQNCGEMDPSSGTWNDYTCGSPQRYVCECEPG